MKKFFFKVRSSFSRCFFMFNGCHYFESRGANCLRTRWLSLPHNVIGCWRTTISRSLVFNPFSFLKIISTATISILFIIKKFQKQNLDGKKKVKTSLIFQLFVNSDRIVKKRKNFYKYGGWHTSVLFSF